MAAPKSTSRNTSLYSLVLAYALNVFSLWKVDTVLVGRPQFTFRQGDSAVVRTKLAPTAAGDESRSVYRLLVSLLEGSDTAPSLELGADPQNEELRRVTALALMVCLAGDRIRRS
jgi:hypothetical protein